MAWVHVYSTTSPATNAACSRLLGREFGPVHGTGTDGIGNVPGRGNLAGLVPPPGERLRALIVSGGTGYQDLGQHDRPLLVGGGPVRGPLVAPTRFQRPRHAPGPRRQLPIVLTSPEELVEALVSCVSAHDVIITFEPSQS
jgi:hypothetical protein